MVIGYRKPTGWKGEPYRHYLAAKKVKTKVDLKKYAGTWKQVSVKNEPWFQRGCKDVTAKYTPMKGGKIKVENTCDGWRKIEGEATSISDDNRTLEVNFGFPFPKGKYEILNVDKDYKNATVRGGKTIWKLKKLKQYHAGKISRIAANTEAAEEETGGEWEKKVAVLVQASPDVGGLRSLQKDYPKEKLDAKDIEEYEKFVSDLEEKVRASKRSARALLQSQEPKELPKGWFAKKVAGEELKRWRENVNMSPSELKQFMAKYGDEAGLSRAQASAQGIKSGRDSARAIIRMKQKPVKQWNENDITWMRRQNSFVARMKGAKGKLYDEKGRPTRKLLALKVWGHDPEK